MRSPAPLLPLGRTEPTNMRAMPRTMTTVPIGVTAASSGRMGQLAAQSSSRLCEAAHAIGFTAETATMVGMLANHRS
jgi:hypothetical protein